jgi:hypothetical protein
MLEDNFTYYLLLICPPFLITFGLIGNIIIVLMLSRKNFRKIPSRNLLRVLAINDTFVLFGMIPNLRSYSNIEVTDIFNEYFCKLAYFWFYSSPANSSFILSLISIERFITVKYKSITLFKKLWFQTSMVAGICTWNLISYGYFTLVNAKLLIDVSEPNATTTCAFSNPKLEEIMHWFDLVNVIFLPSVIMTVFGILLIKTVFETSKRLTESMKLQSIQRQRRKKRDIKYSMIVIYFNLVFLMSNCPIVISLLFLQNVQATYIIFSLFSIYILYYSLLLFS